MNLAIIPARGGSTRLKDKNIRPLGGKPLILWTVEAVLEAGIFDEVIVTSDSDKILGAVSTTNVTLHKRSSDLSSSETPVIKTILQIAEENKHFDTVSYFLPTCPFRTATHIREGFSLLETYVESVVSTVAYQEPVQLAGRVTDNDEFIPRDTNLFTGNTNSLYMKPYYRPNGGFYMSNRASLLDYRNFFGGTTKAYIMDKQESHDINDIIDFRVAEVLLRVICYE